MMNDADITGDLTITPQSGNIKSVQVAESGESYDFAVDVTLSGGDPSSEADLSATVNSARGIQSIIVNDGGTGYKSNNPPSINVSDITNLTGLTLDALFQQNITQAGTDDRKNLDIQIASIRKTIGNGFRNNTNNPSVRVTENGNVVSDGFTIYTLDKYNEGYFDKQNNQFLHRLGFEGINRLVYIKNLNIKIKKNNNNSLNEIEVSPNNNIKFTDTSQNIETIFNGKT